ncbi:MAG TPA: hypothetical protein VN048_00515 [Verrucomicrobiae bacterium]|nr:hypothetical protein [Verrucomicrobiae bacterium]
MVLAVIVVNVIIITYVFLGGSMPPPTPLPNPNGYDDFVKAGQMVKGNATLDYGTLNREDLASLVVTNAEVLKLVRLGLTRKSREPVDYSTNYSMRLMSDLASFKRLAYLFAAEGRLEELNGHPDDAAESYLDGIRFSQELSRGGLITSMLVCIADEHIETIPLQWLPNSLNAAKCRKVARVLESIDAEEEPIANFVEQERLWRRKMYGLQGQIERLINFRAHQKSMDGVVARVQANQLRRRGMILAFAARAYELEKGKLPQSAADLVPDYLKAVPKDPVTGKDLGLGQ